MPCLYSKLFNSSPSPTNPTLIRYTRFFFYLASITAILLFSLHIPRAYWNVCRFPRCRGFSTRCSFTHTVTCVWNASSLSTLGISIPDQILLLIGLLSWLLQVDLESLSLHTFTYFYICFLTIKFLKTRSTKDTQIYSNENLAAYKHVYFPWSTMHPILELILKKNSDYTYFTLNITVKESSLEAKT